MVDHTFVYTEAVRKIRELIASTRWPIYYSCSARESRVVQHDVNVIWAPRDQDLSNHGLRGCGHEHKFSRRRFTNQLVELVLIRGQRFFDKNVFARIKNRQSPNRNATRPELRSPRHQLWILYEIFDTVQVFNVVESPQGQQSFFAQITDSYDS